MVDLGSIQKTLSIIFASMGILSFYFAFIVCGHNIFKEFPFQVSILLATALGAFLFLVSPVSFIIMYPQLFLNQAALAIEAPIQIVFQIHTLVEQSIVAFLLSAIGSGMVIGALLEVRPRSKFLRWANRTFGLNLRDFSYQFAWDGFLRGIKSMGEITVVTNDRVINGSLKRFSVMSEPKQIYLANCQVTTTSVPPQPVDQKPGQENYDNLLLTETSQIQEIRAPKHSLRKHLHELNHCSEASYYLVTAFGFILLAVSGNLTITFLNNHEITYLDYLYASVSMICTALAMAFLYLCVRALIHEFKKVASGGVFYPVLAIAFTAISIAGYWLIVHMPSHVVTFSYPSQFFEKLTFFIIIFGVLILTRAIMLNREIHIKLEQLKDNIEVRKLLEMIQKIYEKIDFNRYEKFDNIVDTALPATPERNVIKNSMHRLVDTGGSKIFLGEEYNVILKWYQILLNDVHKDKPGVDSTISP